MSLPTGKAEAGTLTASTEPTLSGTLLREPKDELTQTIGTNSNNANKDEFVPLVWTFFKRFRSLPALCVRSIGLCLEDTPERLLNELSS